MEQNISPFIDTVQKYSAELNKNNSPDWFKKVRENGLSRFTTLGIPTPKHEDWKYTNLAVLSNTPFKPAARVALSFQDQIQRICAKDEITIVFVNGILNEQLSSLDNLPKGLVLLPLNKAITEHETQIKELLSKYKPTEDTPFVAFNHALAEHGIYIQITDKTVIEKLIHIVHVTQSTEASLTTASNFIILGKSSEATVLETHVCFDQSVYLSTPLTDIVLAENAVLHYCKAQSESLKSFHVGNTRVWQERDSHFDGFALMNGGEITRNDLDIISNGEGTSSTLNGFYGTNGKQHVDNHSSMDHRLPNCTSNQLYKGILNGESHSVFNGKIFVRKIAQKTNSYQLNKNLILGVNCRVDTKPQLEIFADDVKCTHGATIGQLNEDEIFYLQTRCISKKDAVKLLAHGFVEDILNKIQNPAIIKKLTILLEPTFAALE
ncbi:MAG: Fe-S cluster assembly protein SufD [Candidatus Omnitrophica bacterium]|nr:Fe-S cluster assembly protein SufD [Candidatus Omnitrophota bacterium]